MHFLLSSVPGKNGCSAFLHPDDQPACGKGRNFFHGENQGFQREKICAAAARKGFINDVRAAQKPLQARGDAVRFFRFIGEKQGNKGMKDSRYPPPDAAGKGEEYMKKDLKRQIITALAVTAVLGAAGGMTAQAADEFVPGTVLASEDERDILANGTPTKENPYAGTKQYFYGVTGGNVYLDSHAKDLVGEVNGVVNYTPVSPTNSFDLKEMIADKIHGLLPEEVPGIIEAVNDKTLPGSGTQTIKEGTTLKLKGYTGKDWVRYYGAIGGDVAVDTGLTGNLKFDILKIDKTYEAQEPTVIDRTGNVNVKIGSADGAVSVIGGVGGSAAAALGNITVKASYSGLVSADLKLDGKTSATVNGNVNTVVDKNANVLGWMNGGLAAGIGGTASSTVTGDTTLTIDGTGREGGLGVEEGKTDTLSKILNGMKGSSADNTGINAIGVTGGGAAVTTLGGTADAVVGGSTNITVTDASVVGLIGGGAAASVDATGVGSALVNNPVGNDDGTSGFGITADGNLATGNVPTEQNAPIHVDLTNVNQGGTATSKTGDTYIKLEGNGTAIGVFGGGAAAASHTYQWKDDSTVKENDKPEGATSGNEYGSSTAAAETGKSHITINLAGDGDTGALLGGDLNGRGEALGVFGGGAAFAYSKTGNGVADGSGASAAATTKGSEIIVTGTGDKKKDHVGGLFGGGAAVAFNWAKATAEMTDTVDITIAGADVSGAVGGGLAYFTGSAKKSENSTYGLTGMATAKAADTNINVQNGSTVAGILGGGIAIDDSEAAKANAFATTAGTATINVNGGKVKEVNVEGLQIVLGSLNEDAAEYIGGITNAAGNAAIAAGGAALGGGADAYVANAVVNINGGEVKGDIYGGGIAAYGWQDVGGSHVDTSTINLNGGTVEGSIYAGGAASSKDKENETGYVYAAATVNKAVVNLNSGSTVTGNVYAGGAASSKTGKDDETTGYAKATVNEAVINLAGGTVEGILYGTGTVDGEAGKTDTTASAAETSTLNLIGTNTLALASGNSKIQDFTNVVAKAGSETVVDKSFTTTGPALISGGKVTVEDGALLNIKDLDSGIPADTTGAANGNTYKIADKTADTSTFWDDSDLIYDRMSGVYATTEVNKGDTTDPDTSFSVKYKAVTSANANEAADSMTDALGVKDLRGMFREGMSDQWSKLGKESGTYSYLNNWQLAENKTPYQKGMLFGEDAAVTGNTVSIARAMADNVTQRLSFTDDYVQEQGWANQDGGVWAKYMHRKYETDGMSSSVGGIHSSTDYDGVLVGMDLAKNGKFQSGVAIHYGSGEGDGLISHNDYDAWGITLYGGLKDEEAGTNLMADIGWMTSDNDIDGTVAGKRMSADRDVDAWTIGIRGEKEFVSGKNQIVPYAGLRYMSVNPGSYTTYYDGQAAFHNDAENQDLWLLPIGVSFRNETVTNSGWRITPKLDLSYIWAFGDTDTDMTVNAGGYTGNLYYDVMDDSSWLATLGVEAEKDAWTFGINYGYQKGDDTKNKTWYVTAGYSF